MYGLICFLLKPKRRAGLRSFGGYCSGKLFGAACRESRSEGANTELFYNAISALSAYGACFMLIRDALTGIRTCEAIPHTVGAS